MSPPEQGLTGFRVAKSDKSGRECIYQLRSQYTDHCRTGVYS